MIIGSNPITHAYVSVLIFGPVDKWFKSSPFHGGVVGSNPAGVIWILDFNSIPDFLARVHTSWNNF